MSSMDTTAGDGNLRPSAPAPRAGRAARRMLVSTIAITAVTVAAVYVWSDSGADDAEIDQARWDGIAAVDTRTGSILTFDSTGKPTGDRIGSGRVRAVHAVGDRVALVGTTTITLVEPLGVEPGQVIDIPAGSVVEPIGTTTTTHLVVGDPQGGNLLIVDIAAGTVVDVADAARPTEPTMFIGGVRVNDDGTAFAVADTANFQTIIIETGIADAAFVADQPIAVGDGLVATSQIVDQQADVSLVTFDRRTEAAVVTGPPRGGVMSNDRLVMVTIDGQVVEVRPGSTEPTVLGSVDLPVADTVEWVAPVAGNSRMVVAGAGFEALVDLTGSTIFTTTFPTPVDVFQPQPGWTCVPIGSNDSGHSIVDAESGERLSDISGLALVDVSGDGCTVITERNRVHELHHSDGRVRLGVLDDAVVSPDGTGVVWTTTTGRTELVPIDDGPTLGNPVELADVTDGSVIVFLVS